MKSFIFTTLGTIALVFCGAQSAQSAEYHFPELQLVSQQFVPATVQDPVTFDAAKKGAVVIELAAPWDWTSYGLEVVFAPMQCRMVVTDISVATLFYCPTEFAAPEMTISGERLILSISNIDALRYPFFKIASRIFSRTSPMRGDWITFPSALANSVRISGVMPLPAALENKPTNKTLENWIDALINETLRSAVFPASRIQIGVAYGYSLTPKPGELPVVSLPVLQTDWLSDRSTLASELAQHVREWIRANNPSTQLAFLNFSVGIAYNALGQNTIQLQADQVRLELQDIETH